eukprot:TRINITY_DN1211_c1_g1_i1.p1 TRINITY_DN1211_c1_g1~~TRINITY_DN1211_c1_g1_i1.p1  ORF type:complete len:114 (+),score=37.64 TRINITY_DN1211_c1_g1_i1:152-493(+)
MMMDEQIATSSVDLVKEGWLRKEGIKVKNIKLRWFILSKNSLSYYTDKSRKELKGFVLLAMVQSINKIGIRQNRPFCFSVVTTDRIYYFWPNSEAEMTEWCEIIYNQWKQLSD